MPCPDRLEFRRNLTLLGLPEIALRAEISVVSQNAAGLRVVAGFPARPKIKTPFHIRGDITRLRRLFSGLPGYAKAMAESRVSPRTGQMTQTGHCSAQVNKRMLFLLRSYTQRMGLVMQSQRKNSFLLRLPLSLREQATTVARTEQVSLNHFISLAVAEKISRMERLAERSAPAPAGHMAAVPRLASAVQGTHHII